jgi:hypothetical protein
MTPRYWLCPNIASIDLLDMFVEPEQWAYARPHVGVFKFYLQHILGGPVGPNKFDALVKVNAFEKLREWGIRVALEMGSVKQDSPGACDGSDNIRNAAEACKRIADAGGVVTFIAMDEPLIGGQMCRQTLIETAAYTANFIHRVSDANQVQVGWIDAWPAHSFNQHEQFLSELRKRWATPHFWHLDVDYIAAGQQHAPYTQESVRVARRIADAYGVPLGVIITGNDADFDYNWTAGARRWAAINHSITRELAWEWDDIVVQSWSKRGTTLLGTRVGTGSQDIPLNIPDHVDDTLTGLLWDVATKTLPIVPLPQPVPAWKAFFLRLWDTMKRRLTP